MRICTYFEAGRSVSAATGARGDAGRPGPATPEPGPGMHFSRDYPALITSISCTDHVPGHALITWLIMH